MSPPPVTEPLKDVPYKTEPGEGFVNRIVPPVVEKPVSGWNKSFLGIPAWGWVVIGCCAVFGGLLLGMILTAH